MIYSPPSDGNTLWTVEKVLTGDKIYDVTGYLNDDTITWSVSLVKGSFDRFER